MKTTYFIALLLIIGMCSCQPFSSNKGSSEALSDWVFSEWNNGMDIGVLLDSVTSNGGREVMLMSGKELTEQQEAERAKRETGYELWVEGGEACNAGELQAVIDSIILEYGTAGVEIEIYSTKDGCRKVRHKAHWRSRYSGKNKK